MALPAYIDDTIAAIATPPGVGAIGIVRLTGPRSRTILKDLWVSGPITGDKFETHRFYYGKLVNPSPQNTPLSPDIHNVIDRVMAVYFASPRSYTGEDMVEVYCHGGAVVVQEVLAACVTAGARLAQPGEFTRRAFMNGKMDLAQAEAVAAVIHAGSESARRNATEQLSGRLSRVIHRAMAALTELRAYVEAAIDFPEEDIEMIAHAGIAERLLPIRAQLTQLAATYTAGRLLQDGARVVLVGAPNVGKSSLMNALLGQDRSIVHHVPGTTRDYVDAAWNLEGIAAHLTDTAGLRDASETVEQIGVERSRLKMSEADLTMIVCDGTRPLFDVEREMIAQRDPSRSLVVVNKCDLGLSPHRRCAADNSAPVVVSARTGEGLDGLKSQIMALLQGTGPREVEGVTISAQRHKQALDCAIAELTHAHDCVTTRKSAEFVAHHLTRSGNFLGEIVGEVTTDDVLAQIFSKFCIGK